MNVIPPAQSADIHDLKHLYHVAAETHTASWSKENAE